MRVRFPQPVVPRLRTPYRLRCRWLTTKNMPAFHGLCAPEDAPPGRLYNRSENLTAHRALGMRVRFPQPVVPRLRTPYRLRCKWLTTKIMPAFHGLCAPEDAPPGRLYNRSENLTAHRALGMRVRFPQPAVPRLRTPYRLRCRWLTTKNMPAFHGLCAPEDAPPGRLYNRSEDLTAHRALRDACQISATGGAPRRDGAVPRLRTPYRLRCKWLTTKNMPAFHSLCAPEDAPPGRLYNRSENLTAHRALRDACQISATGGAPRRDGAVPRLRTPYRLRCKWLTTKSMPAFHGLCAPEDAPPGRLYNRSENLTAHRALGMRVRFPQPVVPRLRTQHHLRCKSAHDEEHAGVPRSLRAGRRPTGASLQPQRGSDGTPGTEGCVVGNRQGTYNRCGHAARIVFTALTSFGGSHAD